ncbi:histone deacetylase Hos3p [[Candida] anglica]|uniref:Histone deacetylase Hos3p n=1 Tax=[Candida] anglica TaxID=148631 RepID=A0ABP0E6K1_9ASCO
MSNEDDSYEESLISQFETTLSIRPTSNEIEDVSIDHTVYSNYTQDQSIIDLSELEEEEVLSEQIPKFKTKSSRRLSLLPSNATKVKKEGGSSRKSSPSPIPEAKYDTILKPSPLIDYTLERFHRTFQEFLSSNPHISKESPKFEIESQKTLVLLSPYSAEHAFGRKWVTKSYLSTIFERPQRLLASCIGVAAAITMFPFFYKLVNSTKRGSIMSSHVQKVHGKLWPKKLYELCLESYDKLSEDKLEVPDDWNTGDIYLTPKTINAVEGVIGTVETAIDSLYDKDLDIQHDLAFVVIRPPGHHSHACLPSGFCLLNNVQIGIEYAFETYGVTHCAILDIDLHHGDGSQDICWERAGFNGDYGKDDEDVENPRSEYGKRFATYPKVGYFSLHDIKSYPTELGYATKENIKNASTCIMDHDLNIWNVHLQEWSSEDEFYKLYQTKYVSILNRANQFLNQAKKQYEQEYQAYLIQLTNYNKYLQKQHLYNQPVLKPKAPPPFKPLITISAGFDASEYENPQMQRHGVNVPTSFYATFTKDVVKLAKIHTKGKVISFLEGGYSDGALTTGIFSHLIGLTSDSKTAQNDELLWNETWGSQQVMKELIKGCKKNWTPYKKPQTDITIWANEVIKLGRSMMPNAILPANYIYKKEDQTNAVNNMVKGLKESDRFNQGSKVKPNIDVEDRRVLRSYYKRQEAARSE